MSENLHSLSVSWDKISAAISRKTENPYLYERFYIGNIQKQAGNPVFERKMVSVSKLKPHRYFYLSHPFAGVALTRREVQVLYLICQGCTNKGVAQRISLSPRTVEYYIKNIRKKL